MNRNKSLLLPGLLALALTAHAQLSPTERQLTDYVDAHIDASIRLLINTVNINSGTLASPTASPPCLRPPVTYASSASSPKSRPTSAWGPP